MLPFNTILKILSVVIFIQSCTQTGLVMGTDQKETSDKKSSTGSGGTNAKSSNSDKDKNSSSDAQVKHIKKRSVYSCSDLGALSLLAQNGLITFNDFNTNSGTDSFTLVCGSLTNSNSANFATKLTANQISGTTAVLGVGNSIVAGSPLNVYAGSVLLGDDTAQIQYVDSRKYNINGNRLINLVKANSAANVRYDEGLLGNCDFMGRQVNDLFQSLASISANNPPPVVPKGSPGPVIFNTKALDSNGFAIFYVNDGNSVFNNKYVQQIQLNLNNIKPELILINVAGSSINFNYGNFVGSFSNNDVRSRVVFNFFQASQINFHRSFSGSILAPNANIRTDVEIFGSVVANSLTATAAIHGPTLKLPTCVPSN